MRSCWSAAVLPAILCAQRALPSEDAVWAWKGGEPIARIVRPQLAGPMAGVVSETLNGYFKEAFGVALPDEKQAAPEGLGILAGNEENNPAIRDLVEGGLQLDLEGLGEEGFEIVTHATGPRRFVVVAARSPVGLKHGCQELAFFRIAASAEGGRVEWPMKVRRRPCFPYRGIYMLPCWAARDSIESWQRVLRFNSELTLNRVWFWLAGFPLLEEYGGEYKGTDLARVENVKGLVSLCHREGMKFYIGGGWLTWHHEKHAGGSLERGIQYYLDMVKLLEGTEGIYLEPAGEGSEVDEKIRFERTRAIEKLMRSVWEIHPDFEFAVAVGKFNDPSYREALHRIDEKRLYWWWCWGDPIRAGALREHPLVLRWHTVVDMSDYHGSRQPPGPEEAALTGFATSYDPGMGFGNSWNGWGKLGTDKRRDVHPHTMPYFSHQYLFRERCWDTSLTREEFSRRLARRIFDADMPPSAIEDYLTLADFCRDPAAADEAALSRIGSFAKEHRGKGTPRNRDTLERMAEALEGIAKVRARSSSPKEK